MVGWHSLSTWSEVRPSDLRDYFDVFFAMQDVVNDLVKVDFLGKREKYVPSESERELQKECVYDTGLILSCVPLGFFRSPSLNF